MKRSFSFLNQIQYQNCGIGIGNLEFQNDTRPFRPPAGLAQTDARGQSVALAYDALNRPNSRTNAVGGNYRVQYNAQGLPVQETDEDDRTSLAEYDNFSRISKQIDALGNATVYGYTLADGSGSGTLGSLLAPIQTQYPSFTQQNRYDSRERPTSQTLLNPNRLGTEGLVSTTAYDKRGQRISDTDANGKTRTYRYDALGQLLQTTDSLGNTTQALYDARGNLIQITDALGNVNTFTFDRNNRITQETLPLGQSTRYRYDAAGKLTQTTSPNGHTTDLSYDSAGRLTLAKRSQAGGSASTGSSSGSTPTLVRTTSYTWDAEDHLTAWTDIDHSRSQSTSAQLSYDAAGRKTSETITYPGISGNPTTAGAGTGSTLGYSLAYSPGGKPTRLTLPDGTALGYAYSAHGELQSVSIPGEGSISVNQYQWTQPSKTTLPGGVTQNRSLDGLLQLQDLQVNTPELQTLFNPNRLGTESLSST